MQENACFIQTNYFPKKHLKAYKDTQKWIFFNHFKVTFFIYKNNQELKIKRGTHNDSEQPLVSKRYVFCCCRFSINYCVLSCIRKKHYRK